MPKAKSKLAELQEQLQQTEDQYKRTLADYQNLIKQHQKERAEYLQYSNTQLIAKIIPLLDNLQMAHKHLQDPGLEMIIKQFQQILVDEGIEAIQPKEGEEFNEHFHEAIDTVRTESEQNNHHIAETSLPGYKYKEGQVIRHAKVKVYKLEPSS